jgi:protein-S-isoprenylcysteine O-methyltransferase Ste14
VSRHTTFVILILVMVTVRLYFHVKASTWRKGAIHQRGKWRALQLMIAIPLLAGFVTYLIRPEAVAWAELPLPGWLRWLGLALAAIALALMTWVNKTLGKNFSTELRIREDHTLVTTGPYQWVRHPMYSVFVLFLGGCFLLTANWFIGALAAAGLGIVMIFRTPAEERMMIEAFGDVYRDYMRRTPRYWPRVLPG